MIIPAVINTSDFIIILVNPNIEVFSPHAYRIIYFFNRSYFVSLLKPKINFKSIFIGTMILFILKIFPINQTKFLPKL